MYSTTQERVIATLLFSCAVVLIWIGFIIFVAQPGTERWMIIGAGITCIISIITVSSCAAPFMATEARSGTSAWKGALLGMFVTGASYWISALLLAVGTTVIEIIREPGLRIQDAGESIFFNTYFIYLASITLLGPGLLVGGAAGGLFYRIIRVAS